MSTDADERRAGPRPSLELRHHWEPDTQTTSTNQQDLQQKGIILQDYDTDATRIQIQGIHNGHQEIRVHLASKRIARISRTNGIDQVEVSASLDDLDCTMDDIELEHVTFKKILDIFEHIRDQIPRYDQGDSVVLSLKIINTVSPDRYKVDVDESERFGI